MLCFLVMYSECHLLLQDFNDIFLPLTEEEEKDVSYALNGRNRYLLWIRNSMKSLLCCVEIYLFSLNEVLFGFCSREVLVAHEASNIEITRELLQCLSCNGWLNDEVIINLSYIFIHILFLLNIQEILIGWWVVDNLVL